MRQSSHWWLSGFSPFLTLCSSTATGLFSYQVHTARISPRGLAILYCVSIHWLFNGNWMKAGSIPQPQKRSGGQNRKAWALFSLPSAQLGQAQSTLFSLHLHRTMASEALQQGEALHDPAHITTLSELHTHKQKHPSLSNHPQPTRKTEARHDKWGRGKQS